MSKKSKKQEEEEIEKQEEEPKDEDVEKQETVDDDDAEEKSIEKSKERLKRRKARKQEEDEEKKMEDMPEEEKAARLKARKEAEDEDDKEEEEEDAKRCKRRKARKGEGLGESPEEDTASATDADSTLSPDATTPSEPQDVFVPPSSIEGDREQETPMGKSANPELMKSPLFVSLSSQINGIRDAVSKKVDALEKSVNDRLSNVLKDMGKIEKFYKQSFYKAASENVSPESTQALSIEKQIEAGKVHFRQ